MLQPTEAMLLRVFVGEGDHYGHRSLCQAIVARALEMKMAGATVLRGPVGFGHSRVVRSELIIDAGPRLPLVIEIVDTEAQIERFLPALDEMMESGLITIEKVRAIHFRPEEA
jgi:PII-like signaling protein